MEGPVADYPWYLVEAIQVAIQINHWKENLPEEDMPPENIWHHGTSLKAWFDRLKAKWKGGGNTSGRDYEPVPDPDSTIEFDNSDIRAQLMAP